MLSLKSTQANRYRSVKYKLNRDNSMSAQFTSTQKNTAAVTTKYSAYRSRRHPSGFSALNLTDIKRDKSELEQNPEQRKYKRSTYVDSFHFLLNMQKNKQNSTQKQLEQRTQKKQSISRVLLPALNELDSHFTVLDNINLPINYINEGIDKLNEELKEDSIEISKIRSSIKQISQAKEKQIQQIEKTGQKGFRKLWDLLKTTKVVHQQSILKLRSSFQKSKDYLPQYEQKLQNSKDRIINLQYVIFKDVPYELHQAQQFQMISPAYF